LIVSISQLWSRSIFILSKFLTTTKMPIEKLFVSLSLNGISEFILKDILKVYLPKVSNELIEKQDSLSQLISQYNMNKQPSFSDHYLDEPSPTTTEPKHETTKSLFLLDIEHCGGEIVNSSIVSIACVHVFTGRWFYTSVRPDLDDQLKTLSSRIHRKKEEELKQCPYWNVIGKRFIEFIESFDVVDKQKLLISHSKNNLDMQYIKVLNQKHNLQTPSTWIFGNSLATLETLCPEFAYSQKGGIGYSIPALSEKLNISNSKKHDPRFDLICLASILKKLLSPIPISNDNGGDVDSQFEEQEEVDENRWLQVLIEKAIISNDLNSTSTTTTQTSNSQHNENNSQQQKKRKANQI